MMKNTIIISDSQEREDEVIIVADAIQGCAKMDKISTDKLQPYISLQDDQYHTIKGNKEYTNNQSNTDILIQSICEVSKEDIQDFASQSEQEIKYENRIELKAEKLNNNSNIVTGKTHNIESHTNIELHGKVNNIMDFEMPSTQNNKDNQYDASHKTTLFEPELEKDIVVAITQTDAQVDPQTDAQVDVPIDPQTDA